jgi:hypothetical protein
VAEEVVDRDAPDQAPVVGDAHGRRTAPNHDRRHLHERVIASDEWNDVAVVWHQIGDRPTLQTPVQDLGRALLEDMREHAGLVDIWREEATKELTVRKDAQELIALVDDEEGANVMSCQDSGGVSSRRVDSHYRLRARQVPRLHSDAPLL